MKKIKLRRHILIFLAFILCLLIFLLPTAGDLYVIAFLSDRPFQAFFSFLVCIVIVLSPLIIGIVLTKKHPEKYFKSKLVITVWIIIGINLIFYVMSMYDYLKRANKKIEKAEIIETTQ